jgi:hypothetical protein
LNAALKATDRKPLKIEYIPIYKLGVNYDGEIKSMVIGILMIGEIVRDTSQLYILNSQEKRQR